MKAILQKLSSRKFWMAIAGVATGVAMALGVDTGSIGAVAGAVLTLTSVVSYICMEGKIDAERVKQAVIAVQDAVELFTPEEVNDYEDSGT